MIFKKSAILISMLAVLFLCFAFTPPAVSTRVIHDNTPIYASPDYSSAQIFKLPQNAEVERIGGTESRESIVWQKVRYGIYEGYADNSCLYEYLGEMSYTLKTVKAKGTKMGGEINLYSVNSKAAPAALTVRDGAKLQAILTEVDYGAFYQVRYRDGIYFVEKASTTTGLTYNETTALIVSGAALVLAVVIFFIIRFIKKSSIQKSPKNNQ